MVREASSSNLGTWRQLLGSPCRLSPADVKAGSGWGGAHDGVCKASNSSPETQTNLGASAGLCELCALVDYTHCGSAAISGKALRAAGSLPTLAAGWGWRGA